MKTIENTTCEAMKNDHCVGFFGFSVSNAGTYIVGPASDGQKLSGQISSDELLKLSTDADAVASGNTQRPPVCSASSLIPGVSDVVALILPDQSNVQVYSQTAFSSCYLNDESADRKVQTDLHAIMAKYYPIPFPAQTSSVRAGTWGGSNAELTVGDSSANLQLACAHGSTTAPIFLDGDGRFDQAGSITFEGGAEPINGRPSEPAEYHGQVTDKTMNLTVSYKRGSQTVENQFTLNYGATAVLRRCL